MFFEFQIPFLVRDAYNKVFQTTPKWPLANDTVIATDRATPECTFIYTSTAGLRGHNAE